MSQAEKDSFLATRLVGLMIRSARMDCGHDDPGIRQSANNWLESHDEGLASLETGCQHLARLCESLPSASREALGASLGLAGRADETQTPSVWRSIAQDTRLPHAAVTSAIDSLANESYPGAAPELERSASQPDLAPQQEWPDTTPSR